MNDSQDEFEILHDDYYFYVNYKTGKMEFRITTEPPTFQEFVRMEFPEAASMLSRFMN